MCIQKTHAARRGAFRLSTNFFFSKTEPNCPDERGGENAPETTSYLRTSTTVPYGYPGLLTGRYYGVRSGPICSCFLLDDARYRLRYVNGILNRLLCLATPLARTPG